MRHLKLACVVFVGVVSAPWLPDGKATSAQPPAPEATYRNPVLPGDYPDPSIIRVGADYWATATTSQWAPIFPLLHSTDLVNWRRVGAVFQTPPAWSEGSYWAPEIAHDGDRFFIYYTARKKDGPLCIAVADADRPDGPYTDHGPLICQPVGSIDAMAIRDENGRRFVVWKEDGNSKKQPTPLWAQPLSDDGRRLVGEKQEILRNEAPWEAHLIEGPFILRRHGWFYLFYSSDACCGRKCNYKFGVARSRKLLGPWERNPANPIMAGNEHWRCPGHGSLVDDASGRTFLLYHAYHPTNFEYVGRQGLLDEVTWSADGWPAINSGRGPSATAALPGGAVQRLADASVDEGFAAAKLDSAWQWPWDQPVAPRAIAADGGWLVLSTGPSQAVAAAARPTLTGSYIASTVVDVASLTPGARAGLAAFGNRNNLLAVTIGSATPGSEAADARAVTVWQVREGKPTALATERVDQSSELHLRLSGIDRTRFQFAFSADGRSWKTLAADAEGGYLPPWDLAVRVALVLDGPPQSSARFGAFRLNGS